MHSLAEFSFNLVMRKLPSQRSKKEKEFVADLDRLHRVADDIGRLKEMIACFAFALDELNHPEREPRHVNYFLKVNNISRGVVVAFVVVRATPRASMMGRSARPQSAQSASS
jgi:hypothetical protein